MALRLPETKDTHDTPVATDQKEVPQTGGVMKMEEKGVVDLTQKVVSPTGFEPVLPA